jgi:hypothetical protein
VEVSDFFFIKLVQTKDHRVVSKPISIKV